MPLLSRRITRFLIAVTTFFTLAHLTGVSMEYVYGADYLHSLHLEEMRRQFDLESEANLTTWFSSLMLLSCAGLLAVIASARKRAGDRFAAHWQFLSIAFLYLSIDETAVIHEATIKPLHSLFHLTGIFYYAWVILAIPVLGMILLMYTGFLKYLPAQTRTLFVAAGALYVGGALGLEMVEGWIAAVHGERSLTMTVARTFEEVGEMGGVIVFIHALLSFLATHVRKLRMSFDGKFFGHVQEHVHAAPLEVND